MPAVEQNVNGVDLKAAGRRPDKAAKRQILGEPCHAAAWVRRLSTRSYRSDRAPKQGHLAESAGFPPGGFPGANVEPKNFVGGRSSAMGAESGSYRPDEIRGVMPHQMFAAARVGPLPKPEPCCDRVQARRVGRTSRGHVWLHRSQRP
jgi:hypothetical protein